MSCDRFQRNVFKRRDKYAKAQWRFNINVSLKFCIVNILSEKKCCFFMCDIEMVSLFKCVELMQKCEIQTLFFL